MIRGRFASRRRSRASNASSRMANAIGAIATEKTAAAATLVSFFHLGSGATFAYAFLQLYVKDLRNEAMVFPWTGGLGLV